MAGFAGPAVADGSTDHAATGKAAANAADSSTGQGATHSGDQPVDHAPPTTQHGGTSGDIHSPQPISKADANTGGANGQCPGGPYCSTRDGSASGNGNGGGTAVGKPCAGCVGKADNKNPHGQMPNATDHNAGYECDTNHGIARGNPAHTGCLSTQPGCVPTPAVPCVPTPGCVPTPAVPCVPTPGCVPTPAVPCVPNPGCVPTPAVPCVPNPGCVPTPAVPCVSPPQGTTVEAPTLGSAAPPATSVVPSRSRPGTTLPNTGAPEGLVGGAALAMLAIVAGVALIATGRRPGLGS